MLMVYNGISNIRRCFKTLHSPFYIQYQDKKIILAPFPVNV